MILPLNSKISLPQDCYSIWRSPNISMSLSTLSKLEFIWIKNIPEISSIIRSMLMYFLKYERNVDRKYQPLMEAYHKKCWFFPMLRVTTGSLRKKMNVKVLLKSEKALIRTKWLEIQWLHSWYGTGQSKLS